MSPIEQESSLSFAHQQAGKVLIAFGVALTLVSALFCYSARTVDNLALVTVSISVIVTGIAARVGNGYRRIVVGFLAALALSGHAWGILEGRTRASALACLAGLVALVLVLATKMKWLRGLAMGAMVLLVCVFGWGAHSMLTRPTDNLPITFTLPENFVAHAVPKELDSEDLREDRKVYATMDADGVALVVDTGEAGMANKDFFEKVVDSIPKVMKITERGEITTRGVSCPYVDYEGRHPQAGNVRGRYVLVPCGRQYTILILTGSPGGVAKNLSAIQRVADSVTGVAP